MAFYTFVDRHDQTQEFQRIKFPQFNGDPSVFTGDARRSVFIVDDTEEMLDITFSFLSKAGWVPKGFSDGDTFVQAVVDTPPHLCIIDLAVPNYDGIEIVKALAAEGYKGEIVFISGFGPQILRCVSRLAKESNLNIRGWLSKPFTRAQLLETIDANKKDAFVVTCASTIAAIRAGQISVSYEPIIDARNGKVVAAEALARWRHPTAGAIPPDEFVTKLDAEGLKELTLNVLKDVLDKRQQLQEMGLAIELHINIPVSTALDSGFTNALCTLSGNYETCLNGLTAELTEMDTLTDPQPLAFALGTLVLRGLKVAIDDFGTGHSSLTRLQKLPVHMVKIDKSFVLQCAMHSEDRAIIKAIVELGHTLNMQITAEGIETDSILNLVCDAGCDFLQGFLFGKAGSFTELIDLARSEQRLPRFIKEADRLGELPPLPPEA